MASCEDAGLSTVNSFAYIWESPPHVSAGAGVPVHYEFTYSPLLQTARVVATFKAEENGAIPEALQGAFNAGGNPKGHDGELAFFYFDAQDLSQPKLTVYAYNGVSQDSWQDGSNQAGIQEPDLIHSSIVDDSFVREFIAVDNPDGTRTLGFEISTLTINKHSPKYPDINGEPWQGMQWSEVLGIWFHWTDSLTAVYNEQGYLTEWTKIRLGYTDSAELSTQEVQVCVPQCSDGIDNDGDGLIDWPEDPGCSGPDDNDESNECIPGATDSQECSSGLPGVCAAGSRSRTCGENGQWEEYGACKADIKPGTQAEICDDGLDNNCNGLVDAADPACFACEPGQTEYASCETGESGVCSTGKQLRVCEQNGQWGEYGTCKADIKPGTQAEICDDGLDNNCNGLIDAADPACRECESGAWEERACSSGLAGLCDAGKQDRTCTHQGNWTEWSACGAIFQPGELVEDCFDEKDNNCNGLVDKEDPACYVCEPGEIDISDCDTGEQGICAAGEKTRVCGEDHQWGTFGGCQTVITPGSIAEVCDDGFDNDCDGAVDSDDSDCWECQPGQVEDAACDTGLPGVCGSGKKMRMCNSNGTWKQWTRCIEKIGVGQNSEQCGDGLDNNCNGLIDAADPECFECKPGETERLACSSGAPGVCDTGEKTRTCGADGLWSEYGSCESITTPGSEGEICGDGLDNDCDGKIDDADEDCWACDPGATEYANCNSTGLGICEPGKKVRTCGSDGQWSEYGACESKIATGSQAEICGDGLDNDCDGLIDSADDDCWECQPGKTEETSCSSGAPGICDAGTKVRTCSETGQWSEYGACEPDIAPGSEGEICGDGLDNDCDGKVDDADEDCWACTPGATDTASCNTGKFGACNAGEKTRTCGNDGQWSDFGSCIQLNQPSPEICSDGIDNDCDGLVDSDDLDCVQCNEVNNTEAIRSLDVSSKALSQQIKALARDYFRKAKSKADRRWARRTNKDARKLSVDGWTFAWKLPQVTQSCSLSSQCVVQSLTDDKANYKSIIDALQAYRNELEIRIKNTNKKGRISKYTKKKLEEFDSAYSQAVQSLQVIPNSFDDCA